MRGGGKGKTVGAGGTPGTPGGNGVGPGKGKGALYKVRCCSVLGLVPRGTRKSDG